MSSIIPSNENFSRSVLESSPDCLKVLDKNGRLQFMNFNGLCQMEIDDFGSVENQLWWNLWGPEHETIVKESVDKALKGEIVKFTALCNTAKGTPRWWDVTVSPVNTGDGVQQILSVSRDVTEQREAEHKIQTLNTLLEEKVTARTNELLIKNRELEVINAELALFNHIASHDLQEPLRKIQVFSNMIRDSEGVDAINKNYFGRIVAAADRMRNLIQALLEYSQLSTTDFQTQKCDLNKIINKIKENFQDEIIENQAEVVVGQLPLINGSKVLLYQLFGNIIENSLQNSKKSEPLSIHIVSEEIPSEGLHFLHKNGASTYYKISIIDNGVGFENKFNKKIFEIFQQLPESKNSQGTGIGLTISKKIVENHHGWIEGNGQPGLGSTFTVYLPN